MKILISVALALFLVGCSSDTKQASEGAADEKKSVAQNLKDVKSEALETTKEVKEDVTEKAKEVKEDVTEKAKEAKEQVFAKAEEVKDKVAAKVQEVKQAVSTQASGATLYQVCAGCHGADASKAALGKSQIIKGWDAKKIAAALHGYKAGTYGAAMKSVMVGQVSKLSDGDIKALSEYISKL